MPVTQINPVSSTRAFEATGSDGATLVAQNLGPDSCYYATASTVSSGSNDGTLASGARLQFTPSKFFISAGTSRILITSPGPGDVHFLAGRQEIAPAPLIGLTTTIALTNRRYGGRFVPTNDFLAAGIAWEVTTFATNDDPCDVGIFNAAGTSLLASSGAVSGQMNATNGIKYQAFATPVQLSGGQVYYAALSYGAVGGTAATLRTSSSGGTMDALFGATLGTVAQTVQTSGHPLATPLTYTLIANVPVLAVRSA